MQKDMFQTDMKCEYPVFRAVCNKLLLFLIQKWAKYEKFGVKKVFFGLG